MSVRTEDGGQSKQTLSRRPSARNEPSESQLKMDKYRDVSKLGDMTPPY